MCGCSCVHEYAVSPAVSLGERAVGVQIIYSLIRKNRVPLSFPGRGLWEDCVGGKAAVSAAVVAHNWVRVWAHAREYKK